MIPLTTLQFAERVSDLLPLDVVNVVTGLGPVVVGARLADHPDVAMIALTGSVGSGRAVARPAADTFSRVHLELGGKAPVVDQVVKECAAQRAARPRGDT